MIKIILLITFYLISSFGDESNTLQKQNVLYVQNLIDKEEKIAQNFEKYILTEFEIPTLVKLQKDEYLGSNFSFENIMGDPLSLDTSGTKIKLKYAVSKKISTEQNYIVQLYNRELYREYTKVEFDTVNIEKSHIWFDLKSKEAAAYKKSVVDSQELVNYGMANYLEVINASVNELNAELNISNAQYNKLKASVELYRALGGGWR